MVSENVKGEGRDKGNFDVKRDLLDLHEAKSATYFTDIMATYMSINFIF